MISLLIGRYGKALIAALILLCSFSLAHSASSYEPKFGKYDQCKPRGPQSLKGKTLVLQIEAAQSTDGTALPQQGVIVQSYNAQTLNYRSVGSNSGDGTAIYRYRLKRSNKAVEKQVDETTGQLYRTVYYFDSPTTGTWKRVSDNRAQVLSGSFILSDTETPTDKQTAPENHNGITVALSIGDTASELPSGFFPEQGVVLQSYNSDGTYTALGFGPATINHFGTYSFEKVSANVAVEQTLQTADTDAPFTLPFTMVYTFETPTSGTWYQNFGDGLIIFSGTFTTFETE